MLSNIVTLAISAIAELLISQVYDSLKSSRELSGYICGIYLYT